MSILPARDLAENLLPAYRPCAAFRGECCSARWDPSSGHVPRGFIGATGSIGDVRLVLLTAEPGAPLRAENYDHGSAEEMLRQVCKFYYDLMVPDSDGEAGQPFFRNLRDLLDIAWPGLSLEQQLQRTWITDTYLCSASDKEITVPGPAVRRCASTYVLRQLEMFPKALVIALGGKAHKRATQLGLNPEIVHSVGPPGGNTRRARESWKEIPRLLTKRGLNT